MANYSKKESANLKENVIAWQKGELSTDKLARVMLPSIERICASLGRSFGLDHGQQGDLAQEVWLIWQNKIAKKYDPTFPVEPIIIECARRIAFSVRHNPMDQQPDLEPGENEADYFDRVASQTHEEDHSEIDKARALDKIRALLAANKAEDTKLTNSIAPMPNVPLDNSPSTNTHSFEDLISAEWKTPKLKSPEIKPVTKKKTRLTPEQAELVKIRKDLGWSQIRFAEELGIGYPRLVSYEYGKTFSLPDGLLGKARELHENESAAVQARRSKYADVNMDTLLDRWGTILGIKSNPDRVIANILGKSLTSVLRWRAGTSTPPLEEKERMDRLFQSFKENAVKPEDFDTLTPRQRKKLNL